jgi:probable phosphomutase (TIGR03848 family)
MSTVLLVRHGRTTANASGILAGRQPGVHLDETGRAQASSLAGHLAEVPLVAAITSPLERCRETLDLLLGDRPGVPVHVDERLSECDYGDWSGRSLKELGREPAWKVVQGHASAAGFPGGETLLQMQGRAVEAIRDWNSVLGDSAVYVVVSHGDVIKSILADALGMHLDQFQRIRVDPASTSIVEYTALRPFVDRMNDTGPGAGRLATRRPRRGRRRGDAAVGGGAGA